MNSYPLGAVVRCKTTFSIGGTATDPTTISCKVRTPAGVITTNTYGDGFLLRDSQGVYHLDVTTTAAGVWSYRFIATGVAASANEAEFYIDPSDFGASG